VAAENGVVYVWPKFLEDIEYAVEADLRYPFLPRFCPGAFRPGVIEIGDTRPPPLPKKLREIEASSA